LKAGLPIVDLLNDLGHRDGDSHYVVWHPILRHALCWRVVGSCYKRRLPKGIKRKGRLVALGGKGALHHDVGKPFSLMLAELQVSDHGDEDKGGNQAIFAEERFHGFHPC